MIETNLRVGKGIHASHQDAWGWEVSSEQTGYAWGTAGSEVEVFRDAATKLNEVIASKGFEAVSPVSNGDNEIELLKEAIREELEGDNILDFADFEAFEAWLDVRMEYDRRDNEGMSGGDDIGSEVSLRQAYLELCTEAKASGASKPAMRLG